jgi:hypothetical protein
MPSPLYKSKAFESLHAGEAFHDALKREIGEVLERRQLFMELEDLYQSSPGPCRVTVSGRGKRQLGMEFISFLRGFEAGWRAKFL